MFAIVAMALVFVAFFSFFLVPQKAKETIFGRFNISDEETLVQIKEAHGRLKSFEEGFDYFIQRPILGYGLGGFPLLCEKNYGTIGAPHNNYLRQAIDFGIVGFGIYMLMLFRISRDVWKYFKKDTIIWNRTLYISYLAGFLWVCDIWSGR